MRAANFIGKYIAAAGLAAYTLSLGITSSRRRHLITQLARSAGYVGYPRPALPVQPIEAITSATTPVVVPYPEGVDGNVSLVELVVLARLVRERRPRSVFEIGTFDGRTTVTLAANAGSDATVHTLDLPSGAGTRFQTASGERAFVDKPTSGALIGTVATPATITQLYGDSATFDFSPYRADFVFVDGSHADEYVLNDSDRALSLLGGRNGLILWHDYGQWEGVTRALDDLRANDARFARLHHIRGTSLAILPLG